MVRNFYSLIYVHIERWTFGVFQTFEKKHEIPSTVSDLEPRTHTVAHPFDPDLSFEFCVRASLLRRFSEQRPKDGREQSLVALVDRHICLPHRQQGRIRAQLFLRLGWCIGRDLDL
jgi:hypothetical protein